MATGGRIRHHFKHGLWDPKNTVLFVGYQAQGTLGREIVEGAKMVKMMGMNIAVKADIRVMNGFSAHADLDGLLKWVHRIDAWAKIAAATDLNRGSQSFNQQLRVTPESASAHSRDGAIHFYEVERREARRS